MKKYFLIWLAIIFIVSLLITNVSAVAYNPYEENNNGDFIIPPLDEFTPPKTDPKLVNLFDPENEKYEPSLRYGPEGTRFGPPGKRTDPNISGITGREGLALDEPPRQNWGTSILYNPNIYGARALQSVFTDIVLNEDGDYLFAPTLLCPNGCPLELTTYYHRVGGTTCRQLRVFDFNIGDWVEWYDFDEYFMTNYTRLGQYLGAVKFDPYWGMWSAWLLNYEEGAWVRISDYSLTEPGQEGKDKWDMWEEVDMDNNWPNLPLIWSKNLQVKIGSTGNVWTIVSAASGYGSGGGMVLDAPYPHYFVYNYYYWKVGPGPQ